MKIIGLTGRAGSGKDTAADYFCSQHGFIKIALAEPIRHGVSVMFGIDRHDMESRAKKEQVIEWLGKSPRQLMQTLGTEWGRQHVRDTIWLDIAERKIDFCRKIAKYTGATGVVISDIRFQNEAEWLRRLGQLIHIKRRTNPLEEETASHASEDGVRMDYSDLLLCNQRSIAELHQQIDSIVQFMV